MKFEGQSRNERSTNCRIVRRNQMIERKNRDRPIDADLEAVIECGQLESRHRRTGWIEGTLDYE